MDVPVCRANHVVVQMHRNYVIYFYWICFTWEPFNAYTLGAMSPKDVSMNVETYFVWIFWGLNLSSVFPTHYLFGLTSLNCALAQRVQVHNGMMAFVHLHSLCSLCSFVYLCTFGFLFFLTQSCGLCVPGSKLPSAIKTSFLLCLYASCVLHFSPHS